MHSWMAVLRLLRIRQNGSVSFPGSPTPLPRMMTRRNYTTLSRKNGEPLTLFGYLLLFFILPIFMNNSLIIHELSDK